MKYSIVQCNAKCIFSNSGGGGGMRLYTGHWTEQEKTAKTLGSKGNSQAPWKYELELKVNSQN